MRKELKLSAMLLAAAMFVGCDSKKDETTTPAPGTTPQQPQTSTPTLPSVDSMKTAASDAAKNAKDAATNAGAAMKDAASNAADKTKEAMNNMTGGGTATPAGTTGTMADADAQAQSKIAQVTQYIKENKYDLADKALSEVEGMKDKLSPSLQTTVTSLRTQLNGLKAGGAAMPAMPAMPK